MNDYFSTAIHYINGNPHMGHLYENLLADILARYSRQQEKDVFLLTGTDEHGIKNYRKSQELGVSIKDFCDEKASFYLNLAKKLNMSQDDFIRTSDKIRHFPSPQKIWEKLEKKGDIYKKNYEAYYCVGCERFLKDSELNDKGECPVHLKKLEKVKEENYFFRLSKYNDLIKEKIITNELRIIPDFRKNEVLSWLDEGLLDVSFSRPRGVLPWGVPVSNDPDHTMYVWCDALSNYISALDYAGNSEKYQKYWVNAKKAHIIGKDISRFHACIWIGMLLSAEIPLPNIILVHGFLLAERGVKMSKSLGNVKDPFLEIEKYGDDALRTYLFSQISVGNDLEYSEKRLVELTNSILANSLGNFINRVYVLGKKNNIKISSKDLDQKELDNFLSAVDLMWDELDFYMQDFKITEAFQVIIKTINFANKKMDEWKPWLLAKDNPEKMKRVFPLFYYLARQLAYSLEAFLPTLFIKMSKILNLNPKLTLKEKQDFLFADWKDLGEKEVLFTRLELNN